jgi:membrane-bound lytic murein transglycosylase B
MKMVTILSRVGVFFFALISIHTVAASGDYVDRSEVDTFIDEMVSEHQFSKEELLVWFAEAEKKQNILDAISRPAEKTHTWCSYRKIFLTSSRINNGVDFWLKNKDTL